MKQVSILLVLSALADGTLLTGFLKALAAAGFPATAADLGGLLAAVLVALYSRWSNARKLDKRVHELVDQRLTGEKPAPSLLKTRLAQIRAQQRKRKKTNV